MKGGGAGRGRGGGEGELLDFVAGGLEEGGDAVAVVALDEYLAVFGVAADAALGFELFAQGGEVVVAADEACDEGHLLAAALAAVQLDVQSLLLWRQGLDDGLVVLVGVLKVGVGGVDHADAVLAF